jgi:hypothetical protein
MQGQCASRHRAKERLEMIKIQGIPIDETEITEGLARLVDELTDPDCQKQQVAEKLFGLMVMLEQATDNDRPALIERIQYLSFLNTKAGRQTIETYRKTILNS